MGDSNQLERLAHQVLQDRYEISSARVRVLSVHSFNTVMQVDAADGRSVLRVGAAQRIHPPGVEAVEATWLDALAATGDYRLRTLAMTDGARWASVPHPDVDGERVVTRFTWVQGRELRSEIGVASIAAAGRLLARLHTHAADAPRVSHVPNSLHARQAVYFGDRDMVSELESDHGSLFREAIEQVQQYNDALWATSALPHLLHGDFGPHNILTNDDRLQPIDFQDVRYGFAVQDLGITISDLARNTPQLVQPFLDGYADIRSLPDLSPHTVAIHAAARSLNIMNLGLLAPQTGIAKLFDNHAGAVVAWMTSHS